MTTTPHRDCDHPATKAARAKCRRARAKAPEAMTLDQVIVGYYDNSLEAEEIAAHLLALAPEAAASYYDNSLTMEEIMGGLMRGDDTPAPEPRRLTRKESRAAFFAEMQAREAARPKVEITDEIRTAYRQYVSDGIGDTDGYYAPIDIQQWASLYA